MHYPHQESVSLPAFKYLDLFVCLFFLDNTSVGVFDLLGEFSFSFFLFTLMGSCALWFCFHFVLLLCQPYELFYCY